MSDLIKISPTLLEFVSASRRAEEECNINRPPKIMANAPKNCRIHLRLIKTNK